jgi:excisionase family DNA binding protein
MNKTEAAKYLNIGVRSLERYTGEGRVIGQRIRGKTGLVLDYGAAELERFKAELEAPESTEVEGSPSSAASPATALARLPRQSLSIVATQPQSTLSKRERPTVAPEWKLLLTLEEAQALTGLSRSTLRAAIDGKALKAAQIGRAWRIRRGDLEKYLAKLF